MPRECSGRGVPRLLRPAPTHLALIVGFAADPDPAVSVMLFFPNRHNLLDPLDGVTAGLEGGVAVRRGDRDHDARLADLELPDSMDDRDALDIPLLSNFIADLMEHLLSGRPVRLIV